MLVGGDNRLLSFVSEEGSDWLFRSVIVTVFWATMAVNSSSGFDQHWRNLKVMIGKLKIRLGF